MDPEGKPRWSQVKFETILRLENLRRYSIHYDSAGFTIKPPRPFCYLRLHSARLFYHQSQCSSMDLLIQSIHAVSITEHSHNCESCSLNKVATAESNGQYKFSLGNEPLLRVDIPVAQITTHKLELDLRPLASCELDLLEAT